MQPCVALAATADATTGATYAVATPKMQPYVPTEENLKSREEFQDAKFGIFLHWGLYSMLATGEWTMTNRNLNYKEYAKLSLIHI